MKRKEVDAKYQWNMTDIYAEDSLWEKDYEILEEEQKKAENFQGTLAESPKQLFDFLEFSDAMEERMEKVYIYANQKLHEDMALDIYQAMAAKADDIMVKISGALAFAEPEILQMEETTLRNWMEKDAGVHRYEKYLSDLLERKPHVLETKMEQLLAQTGTMSSAPKDTFMMFNNADAKFAPAEDENGKKHTVTHGTFTTLLSSKDRTLRKNAFASMYEEFGSYRNTLAAMFQANVKQDAFYAKVRNYESSRQMHLSNSQIPESVYDQLIDTVHERMDLMYRYVALRKRALQLEEVHMYDLYAPMVADAEIKVTYEEAKQMVKEGLAPMGEEYLSHLQEGFDHGWIDVYENEGKRSGAYSWGPYGVHPYVLMNFQGKLNDVFTLAHEMGHALHSYYSNHAQPYHLAGYKIFVAEVASTCNESLLIHHLLQTTTDKKQRAYFINYFLEQFKGTLYRQTMFAEFERKVHQMVKDGEALTASNLCQIYYELNQLYFGKNIVIDREIEMEWARIPHFYTPFYVYQYATGFSAAIALSKNILENGERAVKDYVQFLKGGGSKDPISLLKIAGVDMSKKDPVEKALDVFAELLDDFEETLS